MHDRGGMCGRGGMHVGHVWQGGVHGRGAWAGGVCDRGGMHAPHHQILRDTVNERAVRILLECILVNSENICWR